MSSIANTQRIYEKRLGLIKDGNSPELAELRRKHMTSIYAEYPGITTEHATIKFEEILKSHSEKKGGFRKSRRNRRKIQKSRKSRRSRK
jgi:hypothetical protein